MNTILIDNIYSKIIGDRIPSDVSEKLNKGLSYYLDGAFFIEKHFQKKEDEKKDDDKADNKKKRKVWDGNVKLFWDYGGASSFLTGMGSEVIKILKESNIPFNIVDQRLRPTPNLDLNFTSLDGEEARPYQDWTVDICFKATRGIIESATGSGKTYIVTKLISKIRTSPFLFLVLSTDLLDQAQETLASCLNTPIGRIGGGIAEIKDINVMTIQTAIKAIHFGEKIKIKDYQFDESDEWDDDTIERTNKAIEIKNLIKTCKGIYFDECHHVAAKTAKDVLKFAKEAYWRFGGSATPYRDDGADLMMQALFGKKLVSISASYLIKHNFLVKPNIFDVSLPKLPQEFRGYPNIYAANVVNNESFNKLIIDIANYFESKDISTLILVRQYAHGENLKKIRPDLIFIKGNQPKKQRKQAIQDLRDGKIKVAIATSLADEGLDIRKLGAVIVAGGGKSITRVYQRVGRTLRKFPGKNKAFAIVFRHNCKFLLTHARRVYNLLKYEKEFAIHSTNLENVLRDIEASL